MKNAVLFFLIVILCACQKTDNELQVSNGLHIANISIITSEDGDYDPYLGHVVVDEGEILYVGAEEPVVTGTFDLIDGTGKFIIPGLIDSHVHLTEVQGMLPHHMEKYPDMVAAFNRQMPRSYLYHGFTTLINLGGISEEQLSFLNNQPLKPEILHTGRSGAAIANGYPMNFAPAENRFELVPNFIYLESEAQNIPEKYDSADHSPAAVVSRVKEEGAIAVKAYYESGFRNMSKLPVPTTEIMEALLEEAHANELVLTVHGNSLEAHAFLTEVGVDIITHGMWNWGKYRDVPSDSLPDEVKHTLDLQIQKQVGYTPTLTVIAGEEALADSTFLMDPALRKVVPGDLIEWYKTEEGQWFASDLFGDYPPDEVHAIYGSIQAHAMRALRYLSDNGGLILFGTDTPSAPTYGNQPGHNGYWELRLMHEAGMSLDQILAAATINNARAFRLDADIGSIAVGKKANLLILNENPLESISAYDAIDKVVLGTQAIQRESLAWNE